MKLFIHEHASEGIVCEKEAVLLGMCLRDYDRFCSGGVCCHNARGRVRNRKSHPEGVSPRDLTYCSHKPECVVPTNPDRSVLITIITWHFQFRPVNVSILHLKYDYRARSESRVTLEWNGMDWNGWYLYSCISSVNGTQSISIVCVNNFISFCVSWFVALFLFSVFS